MVNEFKLFKLLKLVSLADKILLEHASSELKISNKDVLSLAKFLEKQELVEIQKTGTKTYIVLKDLKKSYKKKGKQVISSQNDFKIRVDATLLKLRSETSSLKKFSQELDSYQLLINRSLELAKKDNKELEKIKNLNKINESKNNSKIIELDKKLVLVTEKIREDAKKHDELLDKLNLQEQKIKVLSKSLKTLDYEKNKTENALKLAKEKVSNLEVELNKKLKSFDEIKNVLDESNQNIDLLRQKIIGSREKNSYSLLNEITKQHAIQDSETKKLLLESRKLQQNIENKYLVTTKLIDTLNLKLKEPNQKLAKVKELEKENVKLQKDLFDLRNKILGLNVLKNIVNVKEFEVIESDLKKYQKRKLKLFEKYDSVLKSFKS